MHLFAEPFFYHSLVIVTLRHIVHTGQHGFLLCWGQCFELNFQPLKRFHITETVLFPHGFIGALIIQGGVCKVRCSA